MSSASHSTSTSTSSSAADRAIRNQKQIAHVKQLWWFLASVIAFFTLVRFGRYLWSKLTKVPKRTVDPAKEKTDEETCKPPQDISSPLHRTLSTLTTGFRIAFFRFSVPVGPGSTMRLSELNFILIYISAHLIWLLVDTRDLTAMMYQDRAALLGSSQLPLIVALAGKNNVLSWLTGVSHEKLNVLHRAAARTNFVFVWIHALTRYVSVLPPQFDFTHDWMRSGAVGLASLTIAVILSLQPIRHVAFEFFLVTHIVLVFIYIVAGYYHAREQHMGFYIWPALLIWGFDRALRLGRLVWNNKMWSPAHPGDALVELLSEDTIRLTLRRRISWTPGQHAYVILPSVSKLPFEAHPFTIASIPETCGESKERDVVFIVRGRSGFTQRLRDQATKSHGSRVPAFLDGPYGCPPDLRRFSTCVLIAGGSGISYTLPLLLNLVRLNALGENSAVKRIVFVWAVRDAAHIEWISKTLMQALGRATPTLNVEPRIYITGNKYPIPEVPSLPMQRASTSSSSIEKGEISHAELPLYSALKLIHGRPSMKKLLSEEIASALGPVSVGVAGPSNMSESVRKALSTDMAGPSAVLKGSQPVTLHVETFGM
ncbi:hypothetical protein D9613_005357 [Agrocybe pediades]|uniref:ferric-chelate reductase (NADPH) n=1 Tax=Agrocybe pediades TaxID=84607 RepID=A0A8H4QZA5_9AGAR|nr:hypothetical protein D9613_005357 [Agrocybe pediades]